MSSTHRLAPAAALPLQAFARQWLYRGNFIRPHAWLLSYPAALDGAWVGGWRGGVLGTLLGAALAGSVFIAPGLPGQAPGLSSALSVVVFVGQGVVFARLLERLQQAHRHGTARAEAIFERAPVGIAELGLAALSHPDECAQDQVLRERMVSGQVPCETRDRRFLRKDGSTGRLRLTVNLVTRCDGAPDCFIGSIEDIGEREPEFDLSFVDDKACATRREGALALAAEERP